MSGVLLSEDAAASGKSKKLLNADAGAVVQEMLEGLLLSQPHLRLLRGTQVVLDAAVYHRTAAGGVAVISGGGAGHEPAHAGFVGRGMLSAAVSGDVFASPPVSAVLAAIRAVGDNDANAHGGVLLVVKRYTGDRLNFGMAAEEAKLEGYRVRMCVVGEDCALPDKGITGRRGLAGTLFVHKIAGAAAMLPGATLDSVYEAAMRAASCVGTMGVALTACSLPGAPTNTRLAGERDIEIGLGIHGEPGARRGVLDGARPVDAVAHELLAAILEPESLGEDTPVGAPMRDVVPGARLVLMVNGMGGTSPMELHTLARAAHQWLRAPERDFVVERVLTGDFMTSLDACGASITVLRLPEGDEGDEMLALLDAPTDAPFWPKQLAAPPAALDNSVVDPVPQPPNVVMHTLQQSLSHDQTLDEFVAERDPTGAVRDDGAVVKGVRAVAALLDEREAQLTAWDSEVGDGDCGTAWRAGASALRQDLEGEDAVMLRLAVLANVAAPGFWGSPALFSRVANVLAEAMGGTSGAICQIFFRAVAASLVTHANASMPGGSEQAVRNALQDGVDRVMEYGGAKPGMRTLLDALIPACEVLRAGGSLADAHAAAAAGAEATKSMTASAGRSNYIPVELLAEVPDPGAMAVAYCFEALAGAFA